MERRDPKSHQTFPQDIRDMLKELQQQMEELQKEKEGTVLFQVVREVTNNESGQYILGFIT